jgi:recombination protein RecT
MSNIKLFFEKENVQSKFREMLGKNAPQFITSVLQIVSNNYLLKDAEPISVFNAAATAATLNLPINNSLGFAYIVPFNQKQKDGSYKMNAQFQIGYKGFIQLAQRSGQFLTISAKPVFEGQIIQDNTFEGYHYDWSKKESDKIIGYAAYFKLLNGFQKDLYMTVEELKQHGKIYSQTFKKDKGLWKDNFEAMAHKTVLKLLLMRYAPLSVEMQKAVVTDQSVINDHETEDVTYVDNTDIEINKEHERIRLMIEQSNTIEELDEIYESLPEELDEIYFQRKEQISKASKTKDK